MIYATTCGSWSRTAPRRQPERIVPLSPKLGHPRFPGYDRDMRQQGYRHGNRRNRCGGTREEEDLRHRDIKTTLKHAADVSHMPLATVANPPALPVPPAARDRESGGLAGVSNYPSEEGFI